MNPAVVIGSRRVGPGQPVFVIAEIGINHGGDAATCERMIEAAARAGADAVKLQTVDVAASYVERSTSYAEFKDKQLDDASLMLMMQLAARLDIVLFSTPGDFGSLERIVQLGMPAIKISSGLMTNLPLISRAAASGLPLVVSTGLAYVEEIDAVMQTVKASGGSDIALLKCTALYPAPDDGINLAGIATMSERYGVPIGYSDHTLDDLACLGAVAQGATVIEKHFTLDRTTPGADHYISMEPTEFSAMVQKIRRLTLMRGSDVIRATDQELAVRGERHRCLVARVDIAAGDEFTEANVALKRLVRGESGLSAAAYPTVLGKTASAAIRRDHPISEAHVGRVG